MRAVRQLLAEGAQYVVVATSDKEEAQLAMHEGACTVAAEQLLNEMSAAQHTVDKVLRKMGAVNKGIMAAPRRRVLEQHT